MKRNEKLWSLLALLALTLCFVGCSSGSDGDEGGGGGEDLGDFSSTEIVATSNGSSMVSDFQLSDIELLEEYAVTMKLMKQQFLRYMSDDYQGSDIFCGPGEHSDATRLFELQEEFLVNYERWQPALQRLETQGTYTKVTTRGLPKSSLEFWNALSGSAQVSMEDIRKTLDKGNFWSNDKVQQELFQTLTPNLRDGETNYRTWFNRLNNNDLVYKAPQIHNLWLGQAAGTSVGSGKSEYFNAAVKAGTDNTNERVYKMGTDISTKGGELIVDVLDKVSGGGVSAVKNFNDAMEENIELIKVIQKSLNKENKKLTAEDIKKVLKQYTADKLRDKLPEDIGNELASDVFNDFMDYLHDTILQEDKTGEAAKEVGKTQLKIDNNTGKKIKTVIAQNNNSGKIVYVKPDNSGAIIVTVGAGTVTVTIITEDGQRSTQTVSADKAGGLKELQGIPYVSEPQLGVNPSELEFDAGLDRVGQKVNVTTNCAFMAAKPNVEWLHVKLTKDGVMTVTVDENRDETERAGKIRIAALDDKKKVQKDFILNVKQKGKTSTSLASVINAVTIEGHLKIMRESYSYGETSAPKEMDDYIYFPSLGFHISGKTETVDDQEIEIKDKITVTYPGSKIHFECEHVSYDQSFKSTLSFDIVGVKPPFNVDRESLVNYFDGSKVENLELNYTDTYTFTKKNNIFDGTRERHYSLSLSGASFSDVNGGGRWQGRISQGMKVTNFESWSKTIDETNHNTSGYNDTYVNNNSNKIELNLFFKEVPVRK